MILLGGNLPTPPPIKFILMVLTIGLTFKARELANDYYDSDDEK